MQWERPQRLFAHQALTNDGWQKKVLLTINDAGMIADIKTGTTAPVGTPSFDLLLPGMANVHSHSFQRAMAGLTETASGADHDNFWSWRKVMYDFTQLLTPEHIESISRWLYIGLLKHGYTSVGEFHYLHHDTDGKPYHTITELSDRVITAAQDTGIHITHLPVLYETANFGGVPASDGQKRFVHTADSYLELLSALQQRYANTEVVLGVAPHSLRAITPQSLKAVTKALPSLGLAHCPIHIHIAEQEKEVSDCLTWSKQRPIEWLLDHYPVDARWCLIHATHATAGEISRLAASGAVAGLCPTTEANLGDGIFSAESYLKAGGKFGIGTDSHVCLSPWEELRQLEYAQRLSTRKRAVLHEEATPSIGRTLYSKAAAGGAEALGIRSGCIASGYRADLVALSADDPLLAGKKDDQILDTLVFAGINPPVTDVLVAGRRVIQNGSHILEEESARAMREVMRVLSTHCQ